MISLDSILSAGVHQHLGSHDVGVKEDSGILNTSIDMTFSSEVDDVIKMFFRKEMEDTFSIGDILMDKLEVCSIHDRLKRFHVAGIGQSVDADIDITRISVDHGVEEVTSDETGTAGD